MGSVGEILGFVDIGTVGGPAGFGFILCFERLERLAVSGWSPEITSLVCIGDIESFNFSLLMSFQVETSVRAFNLLAGLSWDLSPDGSVNEVPLGVLESHGGRDSPLICTGTLLLASFDDGLVSGDTGLRWAGFFAMGGGFLPVFEPREVMDDGCENKGV